MSKQRLSWDVLRAVQEAAKEFGIMPRADFNDGDNEGSGFFEVNQKRGVRWNAAKGFLRPAMKRPNLRLVTNALVERGLPYEGAAAFATPRRLALHIAGLPGRQPDMREEKKGPRVGAPDAALQADAGELRNRTPWGMPGHLDDPDPHTPSFVPSHISTGDTVTRPPDGPGEPDAGQSGADAVNHCQVDEPVEHLTGLDSHGRLMAERSGRHGGQRGCREHLEGLGSG